MVIPKVVTQMIVQITHLLGWWPRKTIRETINKDLEINELDKNIVFDITPYGCLIYLDNLT